MKIKFLVPILVLVLLFGIAWPDMVWAQPSDDFLRDYEQGLYDDNERIGSGDDPSTLGGILQLIENQILSPLIGLLLTLALVVFFIGMVKYIRSAGEDDKNNAKQIMWWGIIALFVMVAVWGLVGILTNTFFPGGALNTPPTIPSF